MKKILLVFLMIGLYGLNLKAQEPTKPTGEEVPTRKNVVKLNLFPVGFKVISMQYERQLHKNFSAALGVGALMERKLPGFLVDLLSSSESFGLQEINQIKFRSFFVTPEIRFYRGKKTLHQAPHGFYLGLYGRWSKFSIDQPFTFESTQNGVKTKESVLIRFSYGGTAGGLCMGAQWVIGRVSIDWLIIGAHYGPGYLKGEATGASIVNDPDGFKEAVDEVKIRNLKPIANIVGSTASITISGIPYVGLRSGLSIGFAF